MITIQHIDRLTSALATDSRLHNQFLTDPLDAITTYNSKHSQWFGGTPIELNGDERELVASLPFRAFSILEVYQLLASALENQELETPKIYHSSVRLTNVGVSLAF